VREHLKSVPSNREATVGWNSEAFNHTNPHPLLLFFMTDRRQLCADNKGSIGDLQVRE
jgi:hypothetical protein